jgi:hypothetical protein
VPPTREFYLGQNPARFPTGAIEGRQIKLDGDDAYEIRNYDRMPPFLMSIVSPGDHWMFISSTGALTAGRANPDRALFPYYTEDKIHDSAEVTGSKTILIVERLGRHYLWEPFSGCARGIYRIQRNLRKNFRGNKIIFEEANADLGLTFRYGWFNSERFGFIRKSRLVSTARSRVKVKILDGIQNLLPSGVGSQLQLDKSVLVDAYKKNELLPETGLGLFTLASIPIDRPEPAEALRATSVWSAGINARARLLSTTQLDDFREGRQIHNETDIRAQRGAYFVCAEITLGLGKTASWRIVADVHQGPSEIAATNKLLRQPARVERLVDDDIRRGDDELRRIVAQADGLQKTARPLSDARHFNNVLFNIMRGGVFLNGYNVDRADLAKFIHNADKEDVSSKANLDRLSREYLPLTFSRRHGDPSRPWNRFSISARAANYEGNWRDIFQNWEALATSFPGFTPGMICKFVNASTMDGYNPYRVSRDGFDWETVDPHDPWSHIGYWGDHQLIYLLKLLEILQRHEPATLADFLTREIFAYANVPYRIAPYDQLPVNPKETVHFRPDLDELTRKRVQQHGADGKLVWDRNGKVLLVNLTEKILVSVLAKLSNFVPEAGIWLNTQRPEWNDANNALVGNGASVVTLHHLRRYLAFCAEIFRPLPTTAIKISSEVRRLMEEITATLERHRRLLTAPLTDRQRRLILDHLGRAGSRYRERVYQNGLSEGGAILPAELQTFFSAALAWIDHSIRANRRPDALYHSYNLISLDRPGVVAIRRLYEMLEGQAAALTSGCLAPEESLSVLRALRKSAMYQKIQRSYLLYPDRQLPRFTEKNNIAARDIGRSQLLRKLVADGSTTLIERDTAGHFHFNADFKNARDVEKALGNLAESGYSRLVKRDSPLVLEIFERLFDHQSFTGRSGAFFGYEGLGCIYWHMVSKLLLAAQESHERASQTGAPRTLIDALALCYRDIRAGIGDRKTPSEYGAFPMDPYSHTPGSGGARQPGLTGQVKEDILCRFGELGVKVREGRIHFEPRLLEKNEFLPRPSEWHYFDLAGKERKIKLPPGSLAFTYCQTPIIYIQSARSRLAVHRKSGVAQHPGTTLDAQTSRAIFQRTGEIIRVTFYAPIPSSNDPAAGGKQRLSRT